MKKMSGTAHTSTSIQQWECIHLLAFQCVHRQNKLWQAAVLTTCSAAPAQFVVITARTFERIVIDSVIFSLNFEFQNWGRQVLWSSLLILKCQISKFKKFEFQSSLLFLPHQSHKMVSTLTESKRNMMCADDLRLTMLSVHCKGSNIFSLFSNNFVHQLCSHHTVSTSHLLHHAKKLQVLHNSPHAALHLFCSAGGQRGFQWWVTVVHALVGFRVKQSQNSCCW